MVSYQLYINGKWTDSASTVPSPHTPFGGHKDSGFGVERGEYGLEEFLLAKSTIWSAR